jgi:hypothetical protein
MNKQEWFSDQLDNIEFPISVRCASELLLLSHVHLGSVMHVNHEINKQTNKQTNKQRDDQPN